MDFYHPQNYWNASSVPPRLEGVGTNSNKQFGNDAFLRIFDWTKGTLMSVWGWVGEIFLDEPNRAFRRKDHLGLCKLIGTADYLYSSRLQK